ncbi:MAG: hypothetical protein LIO74_11965 [Ruminococcus sp.]|nr:hypothetical protein [Ruminococcus sp.]
MKKIYIVLMTAIIGTTVCCTACSDEDSEESSLKWVVENTDDESESDTSVATNVTTTVSEDGMATVENFSQLVSFFVEDDNYDPEKWVYNIYVQKVKIYGSDETEIIVGSQSYNTETDVGYEYVVAAEADYNDPYRADGPMFSAKTSWNYGGTSYSASSIIAVALEETDCTADDLHLYNRIILVSTF